jgi:hypothetical protein
MIGPNGPLAQAPKPIRASQQQNKRRLSSVHRLVIEETVNMLRIGSSSS